jgi:hypothetical protein
MKSKLHKQVLSGARENAKAQGFYDGRFRLRVVPDKKKKISAEACRIYRQKKYYLTEN